MTTSAVVRRPLRWSRPTAAAAVTVGLLGADLALDPVHTHVPLCPFKALTGLQCPLCGGLRSVYSLAHADVLAALRDNVVVVAALPVLVLYWADWIRRDRADLPERRLTRLGLAALWLVAMVFTIVRNLPAFRPVLAPAGA